MNFPLKANLPKLQGSYPQLKASRRQGITIQRNIPLEGYDGKLLVTDPFQWFNFNGSVIKEGKDERELTYRILLDERLIPVQRGNFIRNFAWMEISSVARSVLIQLYRSIRLDLTVIMTFREIPSWSESDGNFSSVLALMEIYRSEPFPWIAS